MINGTLFATALVLLAPASEAQADPSAARSAAQVTTIWVDAAGDDFDALASELRLRLPLLEVQAFEPSQGVMPPGPGELTVLVRVQSEPAHFSVAIIVSDGRAFDRDVSVDDGPDPSERSEQIARSVANLVVGIDAGTEPPDRSDAELPGPVPLDEPCPECPVCPDPEPEPPPELIPEPPPEPDSAPVVSPAIELGPYVSIGAVTGLGEPAAADRFAAWGGTLGVATRWPRGAVLVAELRGAGRSHADGERIVRLRASLGGGYAWRPPASRAELDVRAGVAVEPWFVRSDAETVRFSNTTRPLVGAWSRITAGYRPALGDARRSVRIGGYAELAVSSAGGVVEVVEADEERMVSKFRAGGPELELGVQAQFWFALPTRR